MAEEVKGFAEHFSAFKRYWKMALIVFCAIFFTGAFIAASLPDIYRSTAYILIEDKEIPDVLMQSTVTKNAAKQITILNERILTVTNIVQMIERYNLYAEERKNTPAELLVPNVRTAIKIEIQSRETITASGIPREIAIGFTVSFEDESPETTQLVVQELAELYLEENLKVRSEQTTLANEFLEGQVSSIESEIMDISNELAEFKLANSETLPELKSVNMAMMNRTDQELMSIERQLTEVQQNRITIQSQMALIEPNMPLRLPDGSMTMSPSDQLKSLQTQLSVYKSRYSDDHPDVIRTKKEIESVKSQFGLDVDMAETEEALLVARSNLSNARQKYSSSHPDVVRLEREVADLEATIANTSEKRVAIEIEPDNPAYIQLQASLERLDNEEQSLAVQKAEWQRRLTDYEERLMQTPYVQREYESLMRKAEAAKKKQKDMLERQSKAEVGATLETNAKGERLSLIDAPRVPLRPVKPDRQAILALSFLFALVCGLGITQLADALDHSIRGVAAIINVQGVPPLVEIPYIVSEAEIAHARMVRKVGLMATPAVAIILIIVVHFVIVPLDVVWYTALQRLGL